jgi:hypothetical protein
VGKADGIDPFGDPGCLVKRLGILQLHFTPHVGFEPLQKPVVLLGGVEVGNLQANVRELLDVPIDRCDLL